MMRVNPLGTMSEMFLIHFDKPIFEFDSYRLVKGTVLVTRYRVNKFNQYVIATCIDMNGRISHVPLLSFIRFPETPTHSFIQNILMKIYPLPK